MKKALFSMLILLSLLGCSKEEEPAPIPKTGVDLIAIGPLNFGGVLVGEYRDAAVQVINYGPNAIDTSELSTSLKAPFQITSISSPCNTGSLPKDRSCIISVRFRPTVSGTWAQNIQVGEGSINTNGKGLIGGLLTIDEDFWDLGTFIAGEEFSKTFTLKNEGDFSITAPTVELVTGTEIGLNTCGGFMAAGKTCTIEIIVKKVLKGTTDEFINFNGGDSGSPKVQLKASVLPAEPATLISLENPPAQIIADGQDTKTIRSLPIRDRFSNIVADGTNVSLGSNNVTILGPSTVQTINGIISFNVQSTTTRGDATVSIFSGEASGFLRMRATAGPPNGVITVEPYSQDLIANGQTQLVFKTKPLRDQFNNVVEDGTVVYFFIQGSGTLNVATATTILGIAQVTLKAPTTTGSAILQIRGGPYDNGGSTAYTASGDFPVVYVPGPPAGNIPVVPTLGGIYAVEDENAANGSPIQTTVTAGPVLDAQGNIVRTNTEVSLLIENGLNLSVPGGENPAIFTTDTTGKIYFTIAGINIRGPIKMTATSGAASGFASVWAYKDDNLFYDPVINNMQGYVKYFSDAATPAPDLHWGQSDNIIGISTQSDQSYFGFSKTNSTSPLIFASNLPDFAWDCFFSSKSKIYTHVCERTDGVDYFPYEFNAASNSSSNSLIGNVNVDRSGPNIFNNSHDGRVNWPALGYNPIADEAIMLGGVYWEHFDNPNLTSKNYTVDSQYGIPYTPYNIFLQTSFSGFNGTTSIIVSNRDENSGDLGDLFSSSSAMQMTPVKSELFAFGGLAGLLGTGNPLDSLYSYNFNTERWTSIAPSEDENIVNTNNPALKDTQATPSARYQHGMTYIPETDSLYIFGGRELSPDFLSWRSTNDLWKLDLSVDEENQVWSRICDGDISSATYCPVCDTETGLDPNDPTCGKPDQGVCKNFDGDTIPLQPEPDYSSACAGWPSGGDFVRGGNVRKGFMIWHHVYQKAYMFWADSSLVKEFDPYTEVVSNTSHPISQLAGSDRLQVFYNKDEGRTFSFKKNGTGNENSTLYFWDMPPGEKQYLKIDVVIGAGSKNYVQSITPNVVAWGDTNSLQGVNIYAYNYDTSSWVLWNSNNSYNPATAVLLSSPLTNPSQYVSEEGLLTFLITPKGSASSFNNLEVDFLYISGRF